MPDFAPNYTFRYRVHYSALGKEHSFMWRLQRGTDAGILGSLTAKVVSFLNALQSSRWTDFTVMSAEYSLQDTVVFLPAGTPVVLPGTATPPAAAISQSTAAISFVGRSTAGQKGRFFLYGTIFSPEGSLVSADDFRLVSGDHADLTGALGALNTASPQLSASDGFSITYYPYVNLKYNDYWVRRARG
jgi:hypothetical protein